MSNFAGVPDHVMGLLMNADKKHGFPPGTMAAILQQEVGGQFDKYLGDPTAYHYGLAADGVRRTKDGTISTAFGPFGILDSTAKKPGYGVKPLEDKASLEEQIRFASDYLKARIKQNASFEGGIASYGQGPKYARSVVSNIPGYPQPETAQPAVVAKAPSIVPASDETLQVAAAQASAPTSVPGSQEVPPSWEAFRDWVPPHEPAIRDPRKSVRPEQLAGGIRPADFSESLGTARAMMAQNQSALQNGWDTLRGWL